MNRRDFLLRSAITAPILALPFPALAATRQIEWLPGAYESPHALLVARTSNQILTDRVLYTTGEFSGMMGYAIPLTDPRIVIGSSDIMFHPTRGFRHIPSLTIDFYERGFRLGQSMMYSNADYEAYFGKPKPDDQPDFTFLAVHTPYNYEDINGRRDRQIHDANWQVIETRPAPSYVTYKAIEEALGRDSIDLDSRWIKRWVGEHKAETA